MLFDRDGDLEADDVVLRFDVVDVDAVDAGQGRSLDWREGGQPWMGVQYLVQSGGL